MIVPDPRIEIIVGPTNTTGLQPLKLCVNGRLTDSVIHVQPEQVGPAQRQLIDVARGMYQLGFIDGQRELQSTLREALGL